MVYRRLSAEGFEDALISQFREEYVAAWSRNHILLDVLKEVADAFRSRSIPTMALKGAALLVQYYRDLGVRPMADVDFLVPRARADEAITLLQTSGWSAGSANVDRAIRSQHSGNFVDARGYGCDLHWQIAPELVLPGSIEQSDDSFWEASAALDLGGTTVRVLHPSDQLLHVCLHGARAGGSLRWPVDAMTILDVIGEEFDWARLIDQAIRRRASFRMRRILSYLSTRFRARVPSSTMAQLADVRVGVRDRLLARADERWRPLVSPALVRYGHFMAGQGVIRTLGGLPRFMRDAWDLDHFWQVPTHGLKRLAGLLRTDRKAAGSR